ncbi:MAG: very short patch repair endonuclease [Myxococcota bacterium]
MTDVVDRPTRSRMMANIHAEGSRPERVIAELLGKMGVTFTTQDKTLPGKPDFVLSDHHAVIHVHGCFWHQHGCRYSPMPSSNTGFWKTKLEANRARDEATALALIHARWRVLTVWECALRGKGRWSEDDIVAILAGWLAGGDVGDEICGRA